MPLGVEPVGKSSVASDLSEIVRATVWAAARLALS
jgi:hypothetical protein